MLNNIEILVAGAPATGKTHLVTALALALPLSRSCVYRDQQPTGFDLVFLMGLDEWTNSQHEPEAQQQADSQLRAMLDQCSTAFQVLYGSGKQRFVQALKTISAFQTKADQALIREVKTSDTKVAQTAQPWVWPCEKCSDPQCERQLLRRLLT